MRSAWGGRGLGAGGAGAWGVSFGQLAVENAPCTDLGKRRFGNSPLRASSRRTVWSDPDPAGGSWGGNFSFGELFHLTCPLDARRGNARYSWGSGE